MIRYENYAFQGNIYPSEGSFGIILFERLFYMYFESFKSLLYSDTLIPDIFITEYMPSMDGEFLKVYLHCVFLSKHNKQATTKEISRKLGIDLEKVKSALIYLESLGIISQKENSSSLLFNDLKEKEIKKMYRLKTTSTPEETALSMERNKTRNSVMVAINNKFFQGLMSPSWYTDIDAWFDRFKFADDVMYSLFKHCYDNHSLHKNYILAVANDWFSRGIISGIDLDNYSIEYQRFKEIRGKIVKKLKLDRNLTEYEHEYIEKWVMDYKYNFDIIEIALKKTIAKTNPNFKYIHTILTDWNKNGLNTKEEIMAYDAKRRQSSTKENTKQSPVPQMGNFNQRQYDDDYYNSLYESFGNNK